MNNLFLILNYNNYQDTINCVESILKLNGEFSIVIVDNCSNNDSYNVLKNLYQSNEKIHVIKTNENIGFARGNNFGYDYIQKNFDNVDFLHCLNSDIIIPDVNMIQKVNEFYDKKEFYLMGPNILTEDKQSSPIGFYEKISDFKKNNRKMYLYTKLYCLGAAIFTKITKRSIESLYNIKNSSKIRKKIENNSNIVPILSGCYLVYSKKYMDKYDFLFSDITFLYSEESILTYLLLKDSVREIYYNNDIDIIHLHGGSTPGGNKNKAKYVLENLKKMKDL